MRGGEMEDLYNSSDLRCEDIAIVTERAVMSSY